MQTKTFSPRKTMFTKQDDVLHFRTTSAPKDRFDQLKRQVANRFRIMLEDAGFTTYIGVVDEYMNSDYVDGEAIFSFCRKPEFGDPVMLQGGPSDGVQALYAGRDTLETLHYPSNAVGIPGVDDVRPARHYYTLHALNVATGRWIYRHER